MIRKIKEHKDRLLKDPKAVVIILLIVLLASLLFFIPSREKASFSIEDKCGKFVNLFSHTIEDQPACKTRCIGQCASSQFTYKSVDFTNSSIGCNTCMCHCK